MRPWEGGVPIYKVQFGGGANYLLVPDTRTVVFFVVYWTEAASFFDGRLRYYPRTPLPESQSKKRKCCCINAPISVFFELG